MGVSLPTHRPGCARLGLVPAAARGFHASVLYLSITAPPSLGMVLPPKHAAGKEGSLVSGFYVLAGPEGFYRCVGALQKGA